MTQKASWLWNGAAADNRIVFGFSENWYSDDSPEGLLAKMESHADVRNALLASGTVLYGMRVADTAPNSRAFTQRPNRTIKARRGNGTPNVPQDAVLCQCYGTTAGTVKRFWLHCLPDNMVEDSDFVANTVVNFARLIINDLVEKGFKFRHLVQTAATGRIMSIDANGNVTTLDAIAGIAPRGTVQLLKVVGTNGKTVKGKFYVDTVTSDFSFKLANWTGDVVASSGKIRLLQYAFTAIKPVPENGIGSNPTIRPGVRKCGRPFGQLRGRATARC